MYIGLLSAYNGFQRWHGARSPTRRAEVRPVLEQAGGQRLLAEARTQSDLPPSGHS